jgi:hypothetical protein
LTVVVVLERIDTLFKDNAVVLALPPTRSVVVSRR